MPTIWLSTAEFASLHGLSRQSAHKALKRALEGKTWHGQRLVVRKISGVGGNGGDVYEVAQLSPDAETSLSALVPAPLVDHSLPDIVSRPIPANNQGDRISERWSIIERAIGYPPRSNSRMRELKAAAARTGLSVRTLQRWIAELERTGGDVNALARRKPNNAGTRRVLVSRSFDKLFRASGGTEDDLSRLARMVDKIAENVWAGPRQRSGWRAVRRDIETIFREECRQLSISIPTKAIGLSRRRIMGAEHLRRIDILKHDRKRFDDSKPRIRRDNSKLLPMASICMDVKPVDIVMTRPDGSQAWPKMIAFMDVGTHRVFSHFVLLPRGEGVRQEHVTEAFLAMVADPDWGFPQQIYRDNGSEFAHFEKIRAGLQLVQTPGQPTIINARPYSGASKPIESKFAVLDRFVFNQIEGWTGGNRMNKKTHAVGRPTKPYPHNFERFTDEAKRRITDFETVPILTGPFAGRSPMEIYSDHVRDGWRPARISPEVLDCAFCDFVSRKVDRGAISLQGSRYRHPQLAQFNGRTVRLALSWRRHALPMVDLGVLGWAYLEPEMYHLPGDISGAIESSRMQSRELRAIRSQERNLMPSAHDPVQCRLTELPTRAAPAPIIDLIMSDEAEEIGRGQDRDEERVLKLPSAEELRRRRRDEETRLLEEEHARREA